MPHFQRQTKNIEEVIIARYDQIKGWKQDPQAYFLIRVNPKKKRIEVAYVTAKDHVIRKIVYGSYAAAIYYTIIKRKLLTLPGHAAYLGKELYKAELALKYGKKYKQDFLLEFLELPPAVPLLKQS